VLELHRFEKWRGDLVGIKLAEAAETDRELRALEGVLGEERTLREIREAGIGGACTRCGTIHGSVDHFCSACGAPVAAGAATASGAAGAATPTENDVSPTGSATPPKAARKRPATPSWGRKAR
jgi:uncharacterized OB-fold protein